MTTFLHSIWTQNVYFQGCSLQLNSNLITSRSYLHICIYTTVSEIECFLSLKNSFFRITLNHQSVCCLRLSKMIRILSNYYHNFISLTFINLCLTTRTLDNQHRKLDKTFHLLSNSFIQFCSKKDLDFFKFTLFNSLLLCPPRLSQFYIQFPSIMWYLDTTRILFNSY